MCIRCGSFRSAGRAGTFITCGPKLVPKSAVPSLPTLQRWLDLSASNPTDSTFCNTQPARDLRIAEIQGVMCLFEGGPPHFCEESRTLVIVGYECGYSETSLWRIHAEI